jgi:hypothetical protein
MKNIDIGAKPMGDTINFRNQAQVILWQEELCGQLSDGMWENSRPHDHYKRPCAAVVTCNPWQPAGRNFYHEKHYNFASKMLVDCVGERMIQLVSTGLKMDYTLKDLRKDLRDMSDIYKKHVDLISLDLKPTKIPEGATDQSIPAPEVKTFPAHIEKEIQDAHTKEVQDEKEIQRLQNFEIAELQKLLSKARYKNHELEDKVIRLEKAIVVLTDALRK